MKKSASALFFGPALGALLTAGVLALLPAPARAVQAADRLEPAGELEQTAEKARRQAVLRVYTEPGGAEVYVDGVRAANRTPLEVKLAPGAHELRFELEGYRTRSRQVEVQGGESIKIRVLLLPLPERAAQDRSSAFEGAYVNVGASLVRLVTTDIMLGSSVSGVESSLRGQVNTAPGLAIQLRFIRPWQDRAFLIVDTSYQDARLKVHNVHFPAPQGVVDKADLLLLRGGLELSVGPNYFDRVLPYLGGGFNYTVIQDTDRAGWLGRDQQQSFTGYSFKAGVIWNPRHHFSATIEYQYHWAYDLEDFTLIAALGYHL